MPTQRQQITQLIAGQENDVKRAFNTFLADARSKETLQEVIDYLQSNDINSALKLIDTYMIRMSNVIPNIFTRVAKAEAADLITRLGARMARISIGFDPTYERAAALMRQARLNFIVSYTKAQRATTRAALAQMFKTGAGIADAARAFRDSMGLTLTQWNAVNNYRDALLRGSAEALTRTLRDRRFDSTVQSVIDQNSILSHKQIDRMVERYRERTLAYRADNIARTEALRVASQARQEATTQIADHLGMKPDTIERTWRATHDKRTRDTHAGMDGQTVSGLNTPFKSPSGARLMFPGDPSAPAAETVNCRCVITTRIL